jgi:hypothetical protein
LIIDRAEKTLENLENCEKNVRQMAENGRLQPLLRLLLEGTFFSIFMFPFHNYIDSICCCLLRV